MEHVVVTEVDRKILALLREDGRMSYRAIQKQVGLSSTAVHYRVKRLLDGGIIRVAAVMDPARMGLVTGLMLLTVRAARVAPVCDRLAALTETDQVCLCTGRENVRASVVCRDREHLLDVMRQVEALHGVESAELCLYLGVYESLDGPWSALEEA